MEELPDARAIVDLVRNAPHQDAIEFVQAILDYSTGRCAQRVIAHLGMLALHGEIKQGEN